MIKMLIDYKKIKKITLLGHSMGGFIGNYFMK